MRITARGEAKDRGLHTLLEDTLLPASEGESFCATVWSNRWLRFNGHYKLTVSFSRSDAQLLSPLLTQDDVFELASRRLTRDRILDLAREFLSQADLLNAANLSDDDKMALVRETTEGKSFVETARNLACLLPKEERIALAGLTDDDKLAHAREVLARLPLTEAYQEAVRLLDAAVCAPADEENGVDEEADDAKEGDALEAA